MKRIFEIAVPVGALLFSIILTLVLVFGAKNPPVPDKITMTDGDGNEVYGVCISDLQQKNTLKYAYYSPDEFVIPDREKISGTETDITIQKNIAKRGSYQFVFYNLNPEDDNFVKNKVPLTPYLGDDKNWHFTLYLPPCFSACTVYVNTKLVATVGAIEDYNFIDYCEKVDYNQFHQDGAEPLLVDITFYSRREALVNSFNKRASVVTVHYESSGERAGFDGVPMIGSENAINEILSLDRALLMAISLAAALVFAVLAFACCLKKSLFAIPQAALALGVAGFGLFKLLTYYETAAPLAITACVPVFVGIIVAAATLSLLYALSKRKIEFLVAPPIVIVLGIDYLVLPFETPVFHSPVIWLAVLILCFTAFSAFGFFASLERRNVYLTNNLKSEVARQTVELQSIISERDKLLRYLSHDMKKPLSGIKHFVAEIRKNEENLENVKALDIIDGKLNALQSDFSELQKFAKMNFAAESSETVYTDEIAEDIFSRLAPDCEANGITLKCFAPKIAVYAKKSILCSVLDNLVFNAVEHSKCKNITVSAAKSNGGCKITVTDDGIGVQGEREIFLPYYSVSSDGDNLGLGLYICRQHMLSMGGDLVYSRENGKTVFTVTLNLA